jgi:hypothetical protein
MEIIFRNCIVGNYEYENTKLNKEGVACLKFPPKNLLVIKHYFVKPCSRAFCKYDKASGIPFQAVHCSIGLETKHSCCFNDE